MNDDPLPGMSDINRTIAYAAAAKLGELGFEWDGCAWSVTAPVAPIDMVLHCPACGLQHIDGPDERTPGWTNAPHRSHMCHGCGHIWRPADVATNGVLAVKTKGKADSPPAAPAPVAQDKPVVVIADNGPAYRAMVAALVKLPEGTKLYTHPAPAPVAQAGEYQQTRETLAACPPESTLHALSQQALDALDELDAPAPVAQGEPVAVIGSGYQLLWASGEPLADTVKRTGIKVGSVLYAHHAPVPVLTQAQQHADELMGALRSIAGMGNQAAPYMRRLAWEAVAKIEATEQEPRNG